MTAFERFLTDVRVRAANEITDYVCDGRLSDPDDERPDPADVHEDVREDLAPFFEEIRLRVEGPKCMRPVPIGTNSAAAACLLLLGHEGECEPCVGVRSSRALDPSLVDALKSFPDRVGGWS